MRQRVLVVDDEPQFLRALSTNLRGAGYEVDTAATAADALAAAPLRPPDAVILDLLLPDGSGRDVCRELRAWSKAPIILVSAVGDDDEKIAALDAGADDYVTKPFAADELLARIRALGRRTPSAVGEPVISFGDVTVDLSARVVTRNGASVRLTPTEWRLLEVLVRNPGRLVTRETLLTEVWGPQYTSDTGYLRLYLSQLRKKLEAEPSNPRHLVTEAGMGYRFVPDA